MDYNVTGDITPKLNAFDLSHNHFTTLQQGYLYPVAWFECVPGDIYNLDYQALVRVQPLVAPIMNNMVCDLHAFFVPTRLLWNKWEDFITTVDQESIPPRTYEGEPPVWCENENKVNWQFPAIKLHTDVDKVADGSDGPALWEYFGFSQKFNTNATKAYRPVDFLRRAYFFIWNEWFRDENLQEKIDFKYTSYFDDPIAPVPDNPTTYPGSGQTCLRRAWRKDYFTAGFISRQKGVAPALSVGIAGDANLKIKQPTSSYLEVKPADAGSGGALAEAWIALNTKDFVGVPESIWRMRGQNASQTSQDISDNLNKQLTQGILNTIATKNRSGFTNVVVDGTGTAGHAFDVNDLRDMFAIQKFLERLMLSGSRYIEFLQSQFGVSPSDARLQIPERIGGTSFNINISEVIQTSSTTADSPQGNQTGHGLSVSASGLGSYKAEEFGYIMIIANIQPPAVYTDRMPREMFRKTLLDQYNPHFVNLSFQAVELREIYSVGTIEDEKIFNYSGRYDEMREKTSYVTGQFYDRGQNSNSLPGYLQYRKFATAPAFNDTFIECNPSTSIFAVENEDQFLCNFYWNVKALRPLPVISEPGLIDHVYGGK